MIYYNPLDLACKSIKGAISDLDEINISIKLSDAERCRLILRKDSDNSVIAFELDRFPDNVFSTKLPRLEAGLYWYYFVFNNEYCIGLGDNYEAQIQSEVRSYQLLVYENGYKTPEWFKGGIMYQIFPDRFYREGDFEVPEGKIKREDWYGIPYYKPVNGKVLNNDFFGGNLKGIEKKLKYLKSLNVSVIYLNPIFSSYSNHRYDTSDYMQVDSVLGDEKKLKSLITSAKKFGIRIILDGVFNHTGDDSIYFNKYGHFDSVGAYQSKDSSYYSWYCFDKFPDKYLSWWGIDILPTINKNSMEFEDFIAGENGMLEHYAKLGVAGIRLDVVDEIPDSFVVKIRNAMHRVDEDNLVLGEVWEDATNKIAYSVRRKYFQGRELDSVMNYPLKDAIIDFVLTRNANSLHNVIRSQTDNYPKMALDCLMNILGTHDTPRILTVLGREVILTSKEESENEFLSEKELYNGIQRLKFASLLQFTLYGVPSVYYGDEAGLEGNMDPFNRKCYPWGRENRQLIEWYKKLSAIRTSVNLFKDGELNVLKNEKGLFVFERRKANDNVIIAINLSSDDFSLDLSKPCYNLLDGSFHEKHVGLPSDTALVLYRKNPLL